MEEKDKWGLNLNVWVSGKFRCVYCGFDGMTSVLAAHQMLTDHIRPRCKDGTDDKENLTVACCSCNAIKAEWDRSVYSPVKYENAPVEKVLLDAKGHIDA